MKVKTLLVFGIAWTVSDTLPSMKGLLKQFKDSQHIALGQHGDAAFPLYYLSWWKVESDRGSPRPVDVSEFDDDVKEKIASFCAEHGLPYKEPRFWLLAWTE